MAGIICIETEWRITTKGNRRNLNTEPLIRFIGELYRVPYIYRRVATLSELTYYLKQFQKKEYQKYNVLYFSFHGETHVIQLEGEKKALTLSELKEIGGQVFNDRYVHLSSCRTLLGAEDVAQEFKKETGAKILTGYTKSVDEDLAAIHDVALIGELLKRKQIAPLFKALKENYEGLEKKLGFKAF